MRGPSTKECPKTTPGTRYPHRSVLDTALPVLNSVARHGVSGSGKTTLLNLLGGLISPDKGSIMWDGNNIASLSAGRLRKYRRECVGYLFQDYGLVPDLTVVDNVKLAASNVSRRAFDEALDSALTQVRLRGYEKRVVSGLSGGEQQRVALARILVSKPKIVLADEPTGALDEDNAQLVVEHLRAFADQGAVVVVATHSKHVADQADCEVTL
ncbi:ABC transporter ATP-binding protein [Corynebacterium striatum]|uniref:ABC transporter ATP-binding protein n=1 Tax=Corynebacterium striatum TaxID=43770 RepID=UPI003F81CBD6